MSNAESTSAGPALRLEALERLVEQTPVLGLPRLVTVEHLRSSLASARKRVDDSHAMQQEKLRQVLNLEPAAAASEDDMGGISVAGDTTINITAPATPAPTPTIGGDPITAEAGKSLLRKALPLALSAAIGGGAASLPWLFAWLNKPAAVPTAPIVLPKLPDYQLGLEVKDSP